MPVVPPSRRAGVQTSFARCTRVGGQTFVLEVDGGGGPALADRLRRFLLRTKATVTEQPWRCVTTWAVGETVEVPAVGVAAVPGGPWAIPWAWGDLSRLGTLYRSPKPASSSLARRAID